MWASTPESPSMLSTITALFHARLQPTELAQATDVQPEQSLQGIFLHLTDGTMEAKYM